MVASPRTPSTIFWGLGALTIGSKIGGSTMSALEAAGDLEGHQACGLAERSEEHTSELQSQSNLVCRLLLEKKKKKMISDCYTQHKTSIFINRVHTSDA